MGTKRFCDITKIKELISYLKEPQRLNNVKTLCKYMNFRSVIDLMTSGIMFINNPKNMNDLYEYKMFGVGSDWSKICFSSFMVQNSESMAMWSMYAQPWSEGVVMSISSAVLKELVNSCQLVSAEYNKKDRWYYPGSIIKSMDIDLSIARVAYYSNGIITCTGRDDRNYHFSNPYGMPKLKGYIKDSAWDYEKEVRLRVDLPKAYLSDAVYLKLPDSFINQITLTTGPRFEGNLLTELPREFRHKIKIKTSRFKDAIGWIPCDSCIKIST